MDITNLTGTTWKLKAPFDVTPYISTTTLSVDGFLNDNSQTFSSIYLSSSTVVNSTRCRIYNGSKIIISAYVNDTLWSYGNGSSIVNPVIVITGGADVTNADLIAWLKANATLVEEEPTATVITYNGNEIATLEAGQTATIKTAECEVEHDIVVIAGGAKAEAQAETNASVYQFDTFSQTNIITIVGAWGTSNEGYYYAVIPLEIGKVYKVALQNITTLTRFRVAQADSDVIGSATLSSLGYTDSPAEGDYFSFVAEKDYLICYGGTANGGEVFVTSASVNSLIGTKWKMHPTAEWIVAENPRFNIDGYFYEGDAILTTLSSDNSISIMTQYFSYSLDIVAPIVDQFYAHKRWRVYEYYGGAGVGMVCRDLTDTLYLEITGGEDAENPAFVAWLFGAGELVGEETSPTIITYNGNEIASLSAGQTATIKCANTEADFDIVVSAKAEEYTVVGSWVVNDVPQLPTNRIYQQINLKDGMDYQRKGIEIRPDGISLQTTSGWNGAYSDSSKTWLYSYYQIWQFGKTPITVSAEFYEWLTANATLDPASII